MIGKLLVIISFFAGCLSTHAQDPNNLEQPRNTLDNNSFLGTFERAPEEAANNTLSEYNFDFRPTDNNEFNFRDQKEVPLMDPDLSLKKPSVSIKPGWMKEDKLDFREFKKDMSMGDFQYNGKYVTVLCRDHQAIDGDIVRIYLNDEVVESQVYLVGSYKQINIELNVGFNKIDFQALNQGTSGPNTAELLVVDESGNPILRNVWNLATGYKASVIIVKNE